MRRTLIATALAAVMGVGFLGTGPAIAGGRLNGPGYDDISYDGAPLRPPEGFDSGYGKGGKGNPNAYATDNWGSYSGYRDQSSQYDQFAQYDQFSQYDQSSQWGNSYDQYGKPGRDYYPNDPGYDYGSRHQYQPPQRRGFFDYDFGRRMLVPTLADGSGYMLRDVVGGEDLTGGRVAGGFAAGGIESFADYAGNYDRRNDAGSRIASNAIGYGVGNVAYHGLADGHVKGEQVAGGLVEGGLVGFGKYMGDEEPSAVNGLFWGGLTRFGGAMANRGISGEKMDGGHIGGEALRSVIGALGYAGGNEQ